MRTLSQAELAWSNFREFTSFITLRRAIQDNPDKLSHAAIRSLSWKALLLNDKFDIEKLQDAIQESRNAYSEMRKRFMRNLQHPDELDSFADPLSEDMNSPWNALRNDESKRQEIQQDVDRCMPENLYFRQPSTQDMLVDILFVWSKLNQDIGYRQGMHEVLAPIVWVVERDAILTSEMDGQGPRQGASMMFDKVFIEHDSFALFNAIMRNIKSAYDTAPPVRVSLSGKPDTREEPPMVRRANIIMSVYLERVDPPLAAHLRQIEIIPQVFLMKWIRLLFGREFTFDQTLIMWDSLFAHDSSLQCVDLICISMLLRVRWNLMDADYNAAMTMLLKYPSLKPKEDPSSLVFDAMYLQKHLDFDGGYHVIGKQTNRPPPLINRPSTLILQHQRTASDLYPHKENSSSSPGHHVPSPKMFEGLVQDAARSVLARSEKLGISKAVRDAVGEVKKNVSNLQQIRGTSHVAEVPASQGTEDALRRFGALEQRNKALAKMLEGTVDDLWKQHKDVVESRPSEDERTSALTMATARVQLAAVYLDDSSLPLPQDEFNIGPPTLDEATRPIDRPESASRNKTSDIASTQESGRASQNKEATAPRPTLEQSSFSWMLGQEKGDKESARNAFMSASPFTIRDSPSKRSNSYLFGHDAADEASARRGSNSGNAKDKRPQKEKSQGIELDSEDEMVHLGPLK